MVTCTHCGQPVDETTRTTCPLCYTPLPNQANTTAQQAPAAAPQPVPAAPLTGPSPYDAAAPLNQPTPVPLSGAAAQQGGVPAGVPLGGAGRPAGARVSLTGEIIEAPNSGGPAVASGPGSYAGNIAPARPSYTEMRRAEVASSRSGSRGGLVALVVLLVLGLGGFGGWYWWMHRTNPKDQAQKFLTALKAQDWKTLYDVTEIPDSEKSKYTSAQDFADKTQAQLDKAPGISGLLKTVLSNATFEPSDPTDNDGSKATVPVKMTISLLGQSQSQTLNLSMTNDGGVWKVNSGGGNMGGLGFGGMGGMGGTGRFGGRGR